MGEAARGGVLSLLLKKCKAVVTPLPSGGVRVLEGVDVLVEEGVVTLVGEALDHPRGVEVVDCSNHVVLPGLVNSHTHAAMVLFRGLLDDYELFEWFERVWVLERRLTPRVVYLASKLACMEMLASGVTGFLDMYYFPEETLRATLELGIRVKTGPMMGALSRGPSLEWWAKLRDHPMARPVVNVHSLYALSLEDAEEAFTQARLHGLDVHIHVSETRRELLEAKRRYGMLPVELMYRKGWLSSRCILVHLGWATSWEVDYIARQRARCVVCPTSSMKLATSGPTPVHELWRRGVSVAVGTDGACSANRLDVLREARQLLLLYRYNCWGARLTAEHALTAATLNGYKVLGFNAGVVEPGYEADLVVISLRNPHLRPVHARRIVDVLISAAGGSDVEHTIVRGRIAYSPEHADKWASEAEQIERELLSWLDKALSA